MRKEEIGIGEGAIYHDMNFIASDNYVFSSNSNNNYLITQIFFFLFSFSQLIKYGK
jgi:hypothetical protein